MAPAGELRRTSTAGCLVGTDGAACVVEDDAIALGRMSDEEVARVATGWEFAAGAKG